MSKYGNRKTTMFGITFDSKREAQVYLVLRDQEKKGLISDLRLQVPFELIPKQKIGRETLRAVSYIADFTYRNSDGQLVVVDAKGCRTDVYKLKKKLMAKVHGILIHEV